MSSGVANLALEMNDEKIQIENEKSSRFLWLTSVHLKIVHVRNDEIIIKD